jgi:hypothetical protein
MSGEDAPRPYQENLIVPEIKTNKQTNVELDHGAGRAGDGAAGFRSAHCECSCRDRLPGWCQYVSCFTRRHTFIVSLCAVESAAVERARDRGLVLCYTRSMSLGSPPGSYVRSAILCMTGLPPSQTSPRRRTRWCCFTRS